MKKLSKEWFELGDVRKRYFSKAAWVPVYGFKNIHKDGAYPELGYSSEILVVGSAVIFEEHRKEAEKVDWGQYSNDNSSAYINSDGHYFKADAFTGWSNEHLGFRLVLSQSINSDHPPNVEINQDFIFAYGLILEGNKWLKPHAGYEEVIRVERNEKGVITFVEIRTEYLRDYLAARKAALRLYYYRERDAVLPSDPDFDWPEDNSIINEEHNRCEVRCHEIDETGDIPGSTWAVFTARRTDVDPHEDIPDFSIHNDDNTEGESRQGAREAKNILFRVQGELWRAEWIDAIHGSERLGSSEPEEDFFVSLDASGKKVNLETLYDETVGKYLWFDASLVETLLARRGSSLKWYSAETGALAGDPSRGVHFGVNQLGHINAYAYDVARLSVWERKIWVAKNIRPDGGVSVELLSAQMKCEPADTKSPEILISRAVEWLRECCNEKYQTDIFKEHAEIQEIKKRLHRFRSLDENGLRGLGKDAVKYTIERMNKKSLMKILKLDNSELGTLKLLESLLASVTSKDFAKSHMAPLYGVYDLRGADAHLASKDIENSYTRIQIDRDAPFVLQGASLLKNVADTIGVIGTQIKKYSN